MRITGRRLESRIYTRSTVCDKHRVSTKQLIEQEFIALPEPLRREVYDFARFLRAKQENEAFNGLLLSETALAKDWSTPEEDTAWASL